MEPGSASTIFRAMWYVYKWNLDIGFEPRRTQVQSSNKEGVMPKKPVTRAKEADLTHVLVVGEAEMRAPIIEHVRKRNLSSWHARCPETAMSSLRHGLRVAMVVIAMASIEEGCAFAEWVGMNHPDVNIVFASSGENSDHKEFSRKARAAGAKYVVPHAMLAMELPRILAYHLEEPAL